jgi:hypothetical protein
MKKADIYPGFEGSVDDKEYICEYFEEVKSFFATAASRGDAMLLYIN